MSGYDDAYTVDVVGRDSLRFRCPLDAMDQAREEVRTSPHVRVRRGLVTLAYRSQHQWGFHRLEQFWERRDAAGVGP